MIKKGNKVSVQYTVILQDGTVFEKSPPDKPFRFTVGSGEAIRGFDREVEGMSLNEEKRMTVKAEDAYGLMDESKIGDLPKTMFPENFCFKKGVEIVLKDKTGKTIKGRIVDFNEEDVTLDLNHVLAGQDLTFEIKIVAVE